MPRIPDSTALGERTIARGRAPVYEDRSSEILGDALNRSAQQIGQTVEEFAAHDDQFNYARAKSALLSADVEARKTLENDPDWGTYEARYTEAMKKARESAVGLIRGRRSKTLFDDDARLDVERGTAEIRGLSKRKEVDWGRASLNEMMESNRTAALSAGDEATRASFVRSTQDAIQGALGKQYISEQEAVNQRQAWSESYAQGYVSTLPTARQVEALKNPNGTPAALLPPDTRTKLLRQAENQLLQEREQAEAKAKKALVDRHVASVMGEYTTSGPEAGAAALTKLSKSGLPPDVQRAVFSAVNADTSRLRETVQQENASQLADLYTRIASNTAGNDAQVETDLLWQKGAFTPTEYASLTGRIEQSQQQGAIDGAASQQVRHALETGVPIDPANPKVSKALNASFGQDVINLEVGSDPWQAAAAAYATRTRALPEQAESWARAALRSPDPTVAAQAAQFLGGIDTTAPDAMGRIDPTTKSMAAMMNSMISAGTDPAKAVETVRERVLNANPAVVKSRAEQFTAGGKSSFATTSTGALKSLVDRDFDTAFTNEPAVTEALSVDFRSQLEKYFVRTGDIETARELAWSDLKRVYGPTKVNGSPQMMALPPERFGVTPDDVKKDVTQFVTLNPQADGSTADDVVLVPDALTMRQVSGMLDGAQVMPSYRLVTKTGDLVVDKSGRPMRYTLPAADDLAKRIEESQAKAASEAQQSIDQARADRAVRKQRQDLLNSGELR